jgi:hypothetical protein
MPLDISILVLSMFEDDDSVFAALQAGGMWLPPEACLEGRDRASRPGCESRRSHLWTQHRQTLNVLLCYKERTIPYKDGRRSQFRRA